MNDYINIEHRKAWLGRPRWSYRMRVTPGTGGSCYVELPEWYDTASQALAAAQKMRKALRQAQV